MYSILTVNIQLYYDAEPFLEDEGLNYLKIQSKIIALN